jgi:hypothetical protein
VGSGRQRRKDTRQADRVRLVEQLMTEAVDHLLLEGFDCYSDQRDLDLDQDQVETDMTLD